MLVAHLERPQHGAHGPKDVRNYGVVHPALLLVKDTRGTNGLILTGGNDARFAGQRTEQTFS